QRLAGGGLRGHAARRPFENRRFSAGANQGSKRGGASAGWWTVVARRTQQQPFERAIVVALSELVTRDVVAHVALLPSRLARKRRAIAENSSRARRRREAAVPTGRFSSSAISFTKSPSSSNNTKATRS